MLLVGTGRAVCADLPSLVAYPAPEGVDLNDDFTEIGRASCRERV